MKEKMNVKVMALLLAATLMVGGVIGGTIAWLIDKTDSVVNEFTYGDIDIELTESTGDTYHITPGNDISKDPTVTVKAGSEKCWLFVKISKENWPTFTEEDGTTKKIGYELAAGWTFLKTEDGNDIYWREVAAADSDSSFAVLKNDKVTVSGNLTKEEVNAITGNAKLTFTAYAVQNDKNITTASDAWSKISE